MFSACLYKKKKELYLGLNNILCAWELVLKYFLEYFALTLTVPWKVLSFHLTYPSSIHKKL